MNQHQGILEPQHANARLDVARGVSALAVFATHIGQILFWRIIGPNSGFAISSGIIARHAVLIFFLLSGHLITKSVLSNVRRHGHFKISDYAAARVARIYPPLVGATVICLIVFAAIKFLQLPGSISFGLPGDLYRVRDSFTVTISDVLRALTMRGGLLEADGPLWSLFIEVQIYAVVLAIAAFWQRDFIARFWCLLLGVAACFLLKDAKFFVLLWAIGALTALIEISRVQATVGTLLFAVTGLALSFIEPTALSAGMDTFPGMAIQVAFGLAYANILFYAYPRWRYPTPLIASANYSYSLYVMHWPLLMLALSVGQDWVGHSLYKDCILALLAVPAVLLIVIPLASRLERHDDIKRAILGHLPRHLDRPTRVKLSAGFSALLILIGAAALYRHIQSCKPVFSTQYKYIAPATRR